MLDFLVNQKSRSEIRIPNVSILRLVGLQPLKLTGPYNVFGERRGEESSLIPTVAMTRGE